LSAQQPERARTEALARRATERLQALQREADRLASEERTLIGDVRKLEIDRQLRAEELKRVDADAAKVQKELDVTAERTATLEATDKKETPELRARLVEIYKLGPAIFAVSDSRHAPSVRSRSWTAIASRRTPRRATS
jgi:outer membrane murein-binding lipoprotein Lpp